MSRECPPYNYYDEDVDGCRPCSKLCEEERLEIECWSKCQGMYVEMYGAKSAPQQTEATVALVLSILAVAAIVVVSLAWFVKGPLKNLISRKLKKPQDGGKLNNDPEIGSITVNRPQHIKVNVQNTDIKITPETPNQPHRQDFNKHTNSVNSPITVDQSPHSSGLPSANSGIQLGENGRTFGQARSNEKAKLLEEEHRAIRDQLETRVK